MVKLMKKYFPNYSILRLVITRKCNLNCKYCFVKKLDSKPIDYKIAVNAIDYFLNLPGKHKSLNFFGGEPLLEFDLIKKITSYFYKQAKIKNKNVHFYMPTNGTIHNKKIIDLFKKYKFKISVSLDGPEEINNCNRIKKRKDYKKIISSVKVLNAERINAVVTPKTVNMMYKTFLFIKSLNIKEISIDTARNVKWNKKYLDIYRKNLTLIADYCIKNLWQTYKHKISPFHEYFISFLINKEDIMKKCNIYKTMITVSPEGEIIPCVDFLRYNKKAIKDYSAGNVNSKNKINLKKIEKIMNFSVQNFLKKQSRNKFFVKKNMVCSFKDYKNKPFNKKQILLNSLIDNINFKISKEVYKIMKNNPNFIKTLRQYTFEDEHGKKEI